MYVIVQDGTRGLDTLRLTERAQPTPGKGELLIRSAAAGFDPVAVAEGSSAFKLLGDPPFTVGWDLAGRCWSGTSVFEGNKTHRHGGSLALMKDGFVGPIAKTLASPLNLRSTETMYGPHHNSVQRITTRREMATKGYIGSRLTTASVGLAIMMTTGACSPASHPQDSVALSAQPVVGETTFLPGRTAWRP